MFASICVVCGIHYRHGLLPGTHGYCTPCLVLVEAFADDTQALSDEITVVRVEMRPPAPQLGQDDYGSVEPC